MKLFACIAGSVISAATFLNVSSSFADSPPCVGAELATAQKAMAVAKDALSTAISALDAPEADKLNKAEIWLGVRSSSDAHAAKDILRRALTLTSNPIYLCDNSTYKSLGDVYAHVRSTDPFNIKLGHFFSKRQIKDSTLSPAR